MNVTYICENRKCSCPTDQAYELTVSPESILDENNIATFFCPHCNEKLKCLKDQVAA